jgi:hypothetical protein
MRGIPQQEAEDMAAEQQISWHHGISPSIGTISRIDRISTISATPATSRSPGNPVFPVELVCLHDVQHDAQHGIQLRMILCKDIFMQQHVTHHDTLPMGGTPWRV